MFHIVYNPQAAKKKSGKTLEYVKKALDKAGKEYEVHPMMQKGDVKETVGRLTSEGSDSIIALGGDGSLNAVLNAYVDFENHPLGIVPAGTGNDFAAAVGITDAKTAVRAILQGDAKATDFIELAGGVRCMNVCGTGIDVEVLHRYNEGGWIKGKLRYVSSLIDALRTFQPVRMRCVTQGRESEHSAFIAAIGNGKRIGGGMKMCPKARVDDGLLDVVVVDYIGKKKILPAFIAFMSGKVMRLPEAHCMRVAEIEFETPDTPVLDVDGELYTLPLSAKAVHGRLKMYR